MSEHAERLRDLKGECPCDASYLCDKCLLFERAANELDDLTVLRSSADALRELEEWLPTARDPSVQLGITTTGFCAIVGDLPVGRGPTLSAAIRAALSKASEVRG